MQRGLLALRQRAGPLLLQGVINPLSDLWVLRCFCPSIIDVRTGCGIVSFTVFFLLLGNGGGL